MGRSPEWTPIQLVRGPSVTSRTENTFQPERHKKQARRRLRCPCAKQQSRAASSIKKKNSNRQRGAASLPVRTATSTKRKCCIFSRVKPPNLNYDDVHRHGGIRPLAGTAVRAGGRLARDKEKRSLHQSGTVAKELHIQELYSQQ